MTGPIINASKPKAKIRMTPRSAAIEVAMGSRSAASIAAWADVTNKAEARTRLKAEALASNLFFKDFINITIKRKKPFENNEKSKAENSIQLNYHSHF
jgi:hypothetical protein